MKLLLTTIAALLLATTSFADPIHDAASTGDLARIQAELDKGIDINAKDADYGGTALHFAAWKGHLKIVEFLLDNGANENALNGAQWTALFFAASEGHLDVVEYLIDQNVNVELRDTDWRRADYYSKNHKEIAALLLKQIEDSIHKAAELGDIDSVKRFIDEGIDVNEQEDGWTPLHYAAYGGHKEVVALLIDKGANVNARNYWGRTPLFLVGFRSTDMFALLLDNGAEINSRDIGGGTALHYASLSDLSGIGGPSYPAPMVRELIGAGAEINIRDDEGKTPLDWAQDRFANKNMGLITQNGGRKGEDELQYQLKLLQQSFAKLQHLIIADDQVLNQPSIEKLQGVFVIRGKVDSKYEVQYHTGDNDWLVREVVTLQANRQLYIDSSSYDEKRFYRVKLVE